MDRTNLSRIVLAEPDTMVGNVLAKLIEVYMVLILLRAFSTWLHLDVRKTPVKLLCLITDPLLSLIRRIVPPVGGAIDISPAVAIVALAILSALLRGMF
jgi:YggT family protein